MASRDSDNVVLVDMDGVLADFDAAVLDQLLPEAERVARTHFYLAEDYPRMSPKSSTSPAGRISS